MVEVQALQDGTQAGMALIAFSVLVLLASLFVSIPNPQLSAMTLVLVLGVLLIGFSKVRPVV
ncbi:hypothetical protein [Haladaptatus sp. DYSN1]|uniref:hypothetical protein n=1 Tax=unclassified Haladaptatus TaxID=2622732 RepID=UPI002406CA42|nr:hypothetical protein [Haladaptatus sp. DYSN1]